MTRYSLAALSPRVDNNNPARRLYDILRNQRDEMLESVRFSLILKAISLDRTNTKEVGEYNKAHQSYIDLVYPKSTAPLPRTTKQLFDPWKKFFDKPFKVSESKGDIMSKLPPLKNLTKIK